MNELDVKERDLENASICMGDGCEACMETGYYGRTGIYEIMRVNESLKKSILTTSDANKIKQIAVEDGMRTLRQDGSDKVVRGISTTEEILRVTQV
jgi:general secretion pathway protein E